MNILKGIFQNLSFSYCLFAISLLVWSLNKGLDLSDEGYYLMCLKYPSEYFSANQWGNSIVGLLTGWFSPGIISYRLIRLVLTVLSSVYLAFHLNVFIRKQLSSNANYSNTFIVFVFVFSGATLSYSIYPSTISYNSLSVVFLQLIVGHIIYLINSDGSKELQFNGSLVLLGVMLMMLFIAKFSTGIVMLMIVLAVINYRRILLESTYKETGLDLVYLGLGLALFSMLISVIDRSIFSRFQLISDEMAYRTGAQMSEYIYGYYTSVASAVAQIRDKVFWVPILLFCSGFLSRWNKNRSIIIVQTTTTAGAFIYIAYVAFNQNYFDSMFTMIYPYMILLLSASTLLVGTIIGANSIHSIININNGNRITKIGLVATLLLIIPLVGTMGTTNPLTMQAILYLFSWSTLIFILITIFSILSKNKIASYVILAVMLVISGAQLSVGMIFHPYRIAQPLNELTNKLPKQGLYVDDNVFNYVTKIENILEQKVTLEKHHPMLDVNTTPGLVYLLGGKSPGVIWSRKNLYPWFGKRIAESKMQNLEKMILFIPSRGIDEEFVSVLNKRGVIYPEQYSVIGEIPHYLYGYMVYIMAPNDIIN